MQISKHCNTKLKWLVLLLKVEMKVCKGDGPSLESENGKQMGEHYYCCESKIHADRTYGLDHAFHCLYSYVTQQERQQMVLKGRLGLQRSFALHPKPFVNLKKEDLKVEVMAKGLQVDGKKKECYQKAHTSELREQCRVLAVLFNAPKTRTL